MIEAKGIYKNYIIDSNRLEILKGIDLNVKKGEFITIVGPSGAGKSTLLHILGGLDSPSEGKVSIGGQDIYRMDDQKISRVRNQKIGFVFQFYHLLSEFTVLENAVLPVFFNGSYTKPQAAEIRNKAIGLFANVGLSNRLNHFPMQLSGGEKQRVAIVRALMNDPQVLLCDEPTGNLDSASGNQIMSLIKDVNLKSKMTVILVTHNQELASLGNRIFNLKDGVLLN
ncbi:MAG: ABC transporter ATP-binding protein [Candidatus Omnitrophota bacterium]|jgi:ABC-type lipoprotein export system ATPase subunit|nr:MAG: ABC transporter ATP-binding protein [Candidatus Omnitrophota bacterium]